MKTLDEQLPSGYFEGLPNRTLARLEDSSMQTTGTSGPNQSTGRPVDAVPLKERDEDSGLHDIRELASSQRMRLSSKRISTSPPMDDVLASSSGGWQAAVALPEPAKMVSLPEIADLPTKADLKAAEKAAKEAEKAERKSRKSGDLRAAAEAALKDAPLPSSSAPGKSIDSLAVVAHVEAPLHLDPTPLPKPFTPVTPIIGARIAKQAAAGKKSKVIFLGALGTVLAAAAGVAVFVGTQNKSDSNEASAPASDSERMRADQGAAGGAKLAAPAAKQEPTVQSIATDDNAKKDEKPAEPDPPAIAPVDPTPVKNIKTPPKPNKKPGKTIIEVPGGPDKPEPKDKKVEKPTKPKGKDGEPDFDALLKEAGVDPSKQVKKPKLERTSLSAGDFKKGMGAVQGRAQACYAGTQGTAAVRITIAASGAVANVSVSGQFAGTPVAACIQSAIKGASFPPWDGGPQTFGYSYLLSE